MLSPFEVHVVLSSLKACIYIKTFMEQVDEINTKRDAWNSKFRARTHSKEEG